MNKAYLCLGGNLGNCLETFRLACAELTGGGITIDCISSVYTSPAWGMEQAPDFFNQVIALSTRLSAEDLLSKLLTIEKKYGRQARVAGEGYASRTLDLDILFFNDAIIDKDGLHVPHPRLHLRRFVLEPLNELAPQLMHPVLKKTVSQLLDECPDKSEIKKVSNAI